VDEPDTPGELKARALRYLVRREHSRAELARKLAPRAASREVLEALLDELVRRKQLSDERYAEERARSL
jgi:regulatory protein